MSDTTQVSSLEDPQLHNRLVEAGLSDADKVYVYFLKNLDHDESVKMMIDIYEEAAKAKDKEVDAAIKMMADQERWREKEMEKRRQDQEDLDKRIVALEATFEAQRARTKADRQKTKWFSDYNNAHYVTRMLQTRQMAYSAVVRAIVNEVEQVGEGNECAHEVPMEAVKARLIQIMGEEKELLDKISQTRPLFAKYITPDTVDQLLAKTDDRHICAGCSLHVAPGGTFYSLTELDEYVQREKSVLKHGFGETERMVIHMYLAAIGKKRTTDILGKEVRAQAGWRDVAYGSAELIKELSEFHDISDENADWCLFKEMQNYLEGNPIDHSAAGSDSTSNSDSEPVSDLDSDLDPKSTATADAKSASPIGVSAPRSG